MFLAISMHIQGILTISHFLSFVILAEASHQLTCNHRVTAVSKAM